MPLTWRTVTQGSQVILPAYPGMTCALGLFFLIQASSRTSSPAFDPAKSLMSIHMWGTLFLALGLFEVLCFIIGNRMWLRWALVAGCGLCGFWAVLLLKAAHDDVNVSYTGFVWVFFAGLAHLASARSVVKDVVVSGTP